jgi:hypothetical protein
VNKEGGVYNTATKPVPIFSLATPIDLSESKSVPDLTVVALLFFVLLHVDDRTQFKLPEQFLICHKHRTTLNTGPQGSGTHSPEQASQPFVPEEEDETSNERRSVEVQGTGFGYACAWRRGCDGSSLLLLSWRGLSWLACCAWLGR